MHRSHRSHGWGWPLTAPVRKLGLRDRVNTEWILATTFLRGDISPMPFSQVSHRERTFSSLCHSLLDTRYPEAFAITAFTGVLRVVARVVARTLHPSIWG